jgi:methionyl-tRNA formyltransferase
MRIIFMGSPSFAVPSLEAIHHSSHDILAVVTQPDRPVGRKLKLQAPPVKVAAEALSIPVHQPSTTKSQEFVDQMSALKPEILVVVAYGEIVRRNVLELAPHGAVNLHASLLPKYRGAAPIPWAILNGETETGLSTMKMDLAMDAGPIYLQQTCEILPSDTTASLSERLSTLGAPLLLKTLGLIEENLIVPSEQDISAVTYAPKLKKEDGKVDWNKPAAWIARQIRAFFPWPSTFAWFENTTFKLLNAEPELEGADLRPARTVMPGEVINISKSGILVAAGEQSVLRLMEVQPENRQRMTAHDFAIGHRITTGTVFS